MCSVAETMLYEVRAQDLPPDIRRSRKQLPTGILQIEQMIAHSPRVQPSHRLVTTSKPRVYSLITLLPPNPDYAQRRIPDWSAHINFGRYCKL